MQVKPYLTETGLHKSQKVTSGGRLWLHSGRPSDYNQNSQSSVTVDSDPTHLCSQRCQGPFRKGKQPSSGSARPAFWDGRSGREADPAGTLSGRRKRARKAIIREAFA